MAVATGELIRAMNYVEDITATLRRISIYIPSMSSDERKRLAEAMHKAGDSFNAAIADLDAVQSDRIDGGAAATAAPWLVAAGLAIVGAVFLIR